jgi:hypothetical protein
VVDMVGGDGATMAERQRHQGGRIRPARKGAGDRGVRGGKGAAGEEIVEQAQSSCSRPRLPTG